MSLGLVPLLCTATPQDTANAGAVTSGIIKSLASTRTVHAHGKVHGAATTPLRDTVTSFIPCSLAATFSACMHAETVKQGERRGEVR